jgi:hypothetical protein
MSPLEEARNRNTPISRLAVLANDEDWKVRLAVAKNPNLPPYLKFKLDSHNSTRL